MFVRHTQLYGSSETSSLITSLRWRIEFLFIFLALFLLFLFCAWKYYVRDAWNKSYSTRKRAETQPQSFETVKEIPKQTAAAPTRKLPISKSSRVRTKKSSRLAPVLSDKVRWIHAYCSCERWSRQTSSTMWGLEIWAYFAPRIVDGWKSIRLCQEVSVTESTSLAMASSFCLTLPLGPTNSILRSNQSHVIRGENLLSHLERQSKVISANSNVVHVRISHLIEQSWCSPIH